MRVDVKERTVVVASSVCNLTYEPGVHLAPRAHIEQIEAQGKGQRLPGEGDVEPAPQDEGAP